MHNLHHFYGINKIYHSFNQEPFYYFFGVGKYDIRQNLPNSLLHLFKIDSNYLLKTN